MIEKRASIWSPEFDSYWRVIPINTTIIKDTKRLVMGAGLAKQANNRYNGLDRLWGSDYALNPKSQLVFYRAKRLIGFPTKVYWGDNSSLELIENGLKELAGIVAIQSYFSKIVCPQLGCGLGNLDWAQVKPLVEKYFGDDDNFIIASLRV